MPEYDGDALPAAVGLHIDSALLAGGSFDTGGKFNFTYNGPVVLEVYAEPVVGSLQLITVTLIGNNFCKSELCCQTLYGYTDPDSHAVSLSPASVVGCGAGGGGGCGGPG
jgi:hypothetical protein